MYHEAAYQKLTENKLITVFIFILYTFYQCDSNDMKRTNGILNKTILLIYNKMSGVELYVRFTV